MSSRDLIFSALKSNKPDLVDLPVIDISKVIGYEDLNRQFQETLVRIGGHVVELKDALALREELATAKATDEYILDTIDMTHFEEQKVKELTSFDLAGVDKAYIKGTLGVAENGSIWITEKQMVNRLLPFICQNLVVILDKAEIVATMHHAYQKINLMEIGFGSFIAGPSKTADIEQSLVIGAHGARSLTVYLVG